MFTVVYLKEFTDGSLKGLTFREVNRSFSSLNKAAEFVAWCHKHKTNPVKAFGSNYTIGYSYIKTE